MHDTRAEGTKHTEAAGGVTAQYGGERKSLVFEWTSSITNRWDVTKIYKKRVYRSAHNFWCSFRVHRIREQELSRSRFSGISFFHLDQIQKCHKNVTFYSFFLVLRSHKMPTFSISCKFKIHFNLCKWRCEGSAGRDSTTVADELPSWLSCFGKVIRRNTEVILTFFQQDIFVSLWLWPQPHKAMP